MSDSYEKQVPLHSSTVNQHPNERCSLDGKASDPCRCSIHQLQLQNCMSSTESLTNVLSATTHQEVSESSNGDFTTGTSSRLA